MKLNLILFSLLIIFALVKINAHHLYRVNHHALEIEKQKKLFGIDKLNIKRSNIPAVTHVNYSARIQTVHEETNPK